VNLSVSTQCVFTRLQTRLQSVSLIAFAPVLEEMAEPAGAEEQYSLLIGWILW
jgi:hypothetical protein